MLQNIFNRRWKAKLEFLFNSRPYLSKVAFIDMMVAKGYDSKAITAIYDHLVDYLPKNLSSVSIYPDDEILTDYDIDDEDLGDIIESVIKSLKAKMPPQKRQIEFYNQYGNNVTVERMIQFVQYCKDFYSPR